MRLVPALLLFVVLAHAAAAIPIVSGTFTIHQNGTVELHSLAVADGRPGLRVGDSGPYEFRATGDDGVLWSERRELFFGYNGPVKRGVNYSDLSFDAAFVSVRIPYIEGMKTLEILNNGTVLLSAPVPLCTPNGICTSDLGETPTACPADCARPVDRPTNDFTYLVIGLLAVLAAALWYVGRYVRERNLLKRVRTK